MSVSLQRARPWLGTLVEMRVDACEPALARQALDAAFAEIAAVHRCLSFHESASDLSRLHAAPVGTRVGVDPRTIAVLRCALDLAQSSQGCFDPSIGGSLVASGFLTKPDSPFVPDPRASWRDVALLEGASVRLQRPLWLDLGGIAKGYAVDRAVETLLAHGATQVRVNAGGDLRVAGARAEIVHLRGGDDAVVRGAVELRDAALASSAGAATRRHCAGRWIGAHRDGRDGKSVGLQRSASVAAPTCMLADALTKIVLAAAPTHARSLLDRYHAQAIVHDLRHGWRRRDRAA